MFGGADPFCYNSSVLPGVWVQPFSRDLQQCRIEPRAEPASTPRVPPAEAGAYLAFRSRLRDVMGPSLRWDDVVFGVRTRSVANSSFLPGVWVQPFCYDLQQCPINFRATPA